uniref:Uncharacterized protein n=1 Tax=Leersia perrieri TaxID=77586 RepID=A0A0D9X5T8_9ORYZ
MAQVRGLPGDHPCNATCKKAQSVLHLLDPLAIVYSSASTPLCLPRSIPHGSAIVATEVGLAGFGCPSHPTATNREATTHRGEQGGGGIWMTFNHQYNSGGVAPQETWDVLSYARSNAGIN